MLNPVGYSETTVKHNKNEFRKKKQNYSIIKLMIGDIKQTWNKETNKMKNSIFGSPFTSIMFAGRIIDYCTRKEKGFKLMKTTFKIDDGTASVMVHYDPNMPRNKGLYLIKTFCLIIDVYNIIFPLQKFFRMLVT